METLMMIFFCLVCLGSLFALGFCFVTLYIIVTTLRMLHEKISAALGETLPDMLEKKRNTHVDHHRLGIQPNA